MGWLCINWCLLPFFCAIIVAGINGCNGCFKEEKEALLNYKEFLKFHNYSSQISLFPSWVSDPKSDCCTWENVTCDSSRGHVIHLSLDAEYQWRRCPDYVQVFNQIPLQHFSLNISMFRPLKKLRSLNLSKNCFDALFLTKDYRRTTILKMLKTLDLSGNFFNSTTLKTLSVFSSLKNLILHDNRIGGNFPIQDVNSLSRLKKLKNLNLGGNIFDEKIFKYLFALPTLTSLFLDGNNITGALNSQDLCNMKTLQELDLSYNYLNEKLDTCLHNLTSLQILDVRYNNFEGSFPLYCLANHSRLKVLAVGEMGRNLEVRSNKFQVDTENPPNWIPSFQLEVLHLANCQLNSPTRKMPSFLSYQHSLEYIDISRNNLVGMFPNWLLLNNPKLEYFLLDGNALNGSFQLSADLNQDMDRLLQFIISDNKIQGSIPKNIGYFFPRLRYLEVSGNILYGDIPASIGEMSDLKILDLTHNNFTGEIPKQILHGCISLFELRLSYNSLEGQIFPTPSSWKDLQFLYMDNNQFNGTIKEGMLSMDILGVLDISNNKLSGKLPATWPRELGFFSVSGNNFEGEIPKELCKANLWSINLNHNRFFGSIPSCFNMSLLRYIHLQGNSLTGTIPEALSREYRLEIIDFRDNKLSGSIPKSISMLSSLKFLLLGGNTLQDELSKEICKLKGLNFLDLSRNGFTGSIPSCLNNISFANIDYHLGVHTINWQQEVLLFTKSLALSYKGDILNYMSGLDLSSNHLIGEIPNQLGELPTLHALNLSHNYLNGTIPKSFHKLEKIESFDLSYNNLTGSIPLQLQDLNSLSKFNVSYNNLSGRVPDQKQFGSFDESSYYGNLYLHWNISNRGIPTSPPSPISSGDREKDESAIEFTAFFWSFVVSFVTIQLILMVVLWINPNWRRAWFYFIKICLYKCFGQFLPDIFF